jgi:hypothetical protein
LGNKGDVMKYFEEQKTVKEEKEVQEKKASATFKIEMNDEEMKLRDSA